MVIWILGMYIHNWKKIKNNIKKRLHCLMSSIMPKIPEWIQPRFVWHQSRSPPPLNTRWMGCLGKGWKQGRHTMDHVVFLQQTSRGFSWQMEHEGWSPKAPHLPSPLDFSLYLDKTQISLILSVSRSRGKRHTKTYVLQTIGLNRNFKIFKCWIHYCFND